MDRLTGPLPELDGPAAPPRKNGELVFQAPWEGRVFSMALALQGAGAYQWREFSDGLAREIATAGRQAPGAVLPVAPDADAEYYQLWLASLEHLLVEKGLVSPEELEARTAEFAMGTWDDH